MLAAGGRSPDAAAQFIARAPERIKAIIFIHGVINNCAYCRPQAGRIYQLSMAIFDGK
jgi:hypothetical protein